jgi:hypothetical protein
LGGDSGLNPAHCVHYAGTPDDGDKIYVNLVIDRVIQIG